MSYAKEVPEPLPPFKPCVKGWRCAAWPIARPPHPLGHRGLPCDDWDHVNPVRGFTDAGGVILDCGDAGLMHDPDPQWLCTPGGRWRHVPSGKAFSTEEQAADYAHELARK
jgi:hypothetical protein